jgi:hypothetical protein
LLGRPASAAESLHSNSIIHTESGATSGGIKCAGAVWFSRPPQQRNVTHRKQGQSSQWWFAHSPSKTALASSRETQRLRMLVVSDSTARLSGKDTSPSGDTSELQPALLLGHSPIDEASGGQCAVFIGGGFSYRIPPSVGKSPEMATMSASSGDNR